MTRQEKAWTRRRIREVDASARRLAAQTIPHQKLPWEVQRDKDKALEEENSNLRARNVDLERMVDDLQDEIADVKRQLKVATAAVVRLRRKS